jgi:hypothetical protein
LHQANQPRDGSRATELEPPLGWSGAERRRGHVGDETRGHVQRKQSLRGWISMATSSLPIAAAAGPAARTGEGGRGEIERESSSRECEERDRDWVEEGQMKKISVSR